LAVLSAGIGLAMLFVSRYSRQLKDLPKTSEVDGFENDDKCRLHFKNVVNQHVGLENSHYLRFEILNISGKKIAAVECERSREPVFLYAKNDESFYIRSGPSSVRLPVSKAFRYMQNHFH